MSSQPAKRKFKQVAQGFQDAHGIAWDQMNTLYFVDTLTPGALDTAGAIFTFPCESFQNGTFEMKLQKVVEIDGAFDVAYVPAEPVKTDHSLLSIMEDAITSSWFWPI